MDRQFADNQFYQQGTVAELTVFKLLENEGYLVRKLPNNAKSADCIIVDPRTH